MTATSPDGRRHYSGSVHAVVLAAGCGRRMRPYSDRTHKALLPVGGTTIISRIVEALVAVDVRGITVVTGYQAADIRAHLLREHPDVPFEFVDNHRFLDTNNIVSLALALESISQDEDIILAECDLLFEPKMMARLAGAERGNMALVDKYRPGMDGTVVSVKDGIVSAVYPPELQDSEFRLSDKYKTLNLYRFDRHFVRATLAPHVRWYADEVDPNCFYELVLSRLPALEDYRIAAEVVEGDRWAEVDDPNDLAGARFVFEPEARAELLDRTMGARWNLEVTDFSFIRNAYFPTAPMIAAMRHALPDLMDSYGSTQTVLNEKLSWFLFCDPGRIQILHGASQAYPLLADLLRGKEIAIPAPSFGEYHRLFGSHRTYADRPGIDTEALGRLAREVDVVVIVNPNNPTGTTVGTGAIHEMAARNPATTFLLDESFVDFSGETPSLVRLEEEPLQNVIVVASMSKSLGVPGLRLGYLYSGDTATICEIGRRLPIWNLGSPAEYLLELLLKYRPQLKESVARTVEDRTRLAEDLIAAPGVAAVYPSGANFLLVRLHGGPGAAGALRRRLLVHDAIDVKDVTSRFDDHLPRIRVALRDHDDNQRLMGAISNAYQVLGPDWSVPK